MIATSRRHDRGSPKIVRLLRMGPGRVGLLIEAVASLALARLIVATTAPARVADRLGRAVTTGTGDDEASAAPCGRVQQIGWAIGCAAANVPFRALCLEQAIAARAMFDRRAIPAIVHYGVVPDTGDGGGMFAHAWTDVARQPVTGYPLRPSFHEIARFASRRLKDARHDAG